MALEMLIGSPGQTSPSQLAPPQVPSTSTLDDEHATPSQSAA
jgi:hypothetical protein